jgi:hypothetical protein
VHNYCSEMARDMHLCKAPGAIHILTNADLIQLHALFPTVFRLKEVDHDKDHHPEGDGFHHTLRCLKCVKKPNPNLVLAILLHDTGKATTMTEGNGFRFPRRSMESRRISGRECRRVYPTSMYSMSSQVQSLSSRSRRFPGTTMKCWLTPASTMIL